MSQVITRGNAPKLLWPGINRIWGLSYAEIPTQYTEIFKVETSQKAYEELMEHTGFGLASSKPEAESIVYDTDAPGPITRARHVGYALGFMVTHEEARDNLYMEVAKRRVPRLARSMRLTKEHVHAQLLNRAFTSTFTFGDGKEAIATDHPTFNGTQSNELDAPSDLNQAAIEDMLIQVENATDSRGLKANQSGKSLIVPTSLMFDAIRILKSILQSDTAENAVNALRAAGSLPDGVKVNKFLSSTTAWFVKTDVPDGLISFQREGVLFGEDGAFDNMVQKYMAYEAYVPTLGDWRALYGTAGA